MVNAIPVPVPVLYSLTPVEGPEASVPVSQKKRRFGTKMDVEAWSSHTPWADLNVRGDRWW